VAALGVGDRLARTFISINPVESMISIAGTTTRNVRRWKDGEAVRRWTAAGMLNAERSFRWVKGCKDMTTRVAALARHVQEATVTTAA
jgi:putative transposase